MNGRCTKELFAALREAGWRIEVTRRGHAMAYSPDGKHIVPVTDGGDWRAFRNNVARLKRAGFNYRKVHA